MKNRTIIGIGLFALFAVGCQSTQDISRRPAYVYGGGVTEYLPGLGGGAPRAELVNQTPSAPGPPVDTVSYWDGDNVSGTPAIKIDLSDQKAYFYKSGQLVGVSAISTGDVKHRTPTGTFKISQKSKNHASNMYGDFVDKWDNYMVRDVAAKDTPPPGGRFKGSPMPNFMRFNSAIGMHAGFLPGYPASHGCVRMPEWMSEKFFNNVSNGTKVSVVP